jgi:hypothetical protein
VVIIDEAEDDRLISNDTSASTDACDGGSGSRDTSPQLRRGGAGRGGGAAGGHALVLRPNLVNHVCDGCERAVNAHRVSVSANAADDVNWQAYRWV